MAVIELARVRATRRSGDGRTWDEAVQRWRAESRHRAERTIYREEQFLAWLRPHLAGVPLDQITRGRLADIRSAGLASGWSNRTANYAAGTVSTIMRAASEWDWVPAAPRLRSLKIPEHRTRWLTREEAARLVDELPPHLADMATFALETGLRKGTLCALRWDWVDLPGLCLRVPGAAMKQRRPLIVPLSVTAELLLKRRAGSRSSPFVWTFRGRRVVQPAARTWREAVARAGLEDFTWHDLRHTWASWHVQRGTPIAVLKDLGGWKTMQMVTVYAHLQTRQLFQAVRG